MEHKIVEFNDLQEKIEHYKHLDKKVVLCYGFFGVLHIGHIRYLKKAREYGDILVVVLRFDDLRGSNNMSYYVSLRAQALAHLDWVDLVAVNENMTLREAIKTLKPNVYARGFESVYTNGRVYQDSEDEKIFKEQLKRSILNSYQVQRMDGKARFVIRRIAKAYLSNPQQMHDGMVSLLFQRCYPDKDSIKYIFLGDKRAWLDKVYYSSRSPEYRESLLRLICDYISGMTDDFAIIEHARLYSTSENVSLRHY